VVDRDFFQRDPAAQECRHDFRRLEKMPVRAMPARLRARCAHHLGRILDVVPMPVREPQFRQLALLPREDRLHACQDVTRRVHEDRFAARGVG
jgi:hypothetical protein